MEKIKVKAVRDWPTPTNVKEVRGFLGFANYYRRMIQGFAQTASALTNLTKKDVAWQWTAKEDDAFQGIKQKILEEPVLKIADPERPFEVETDASDYALGAQLGQRDDQGILHPIAFFSKKLHGAELNYQIHDKELMAIIEALKEWRPYLCGAKHQVQIYTDHKNLTYFATRQQLSQRQTRWVEFLAPYDIKINYIKGSENARADALSRRPDYDQEIPANMQAIFQGQPDGALEITRNIRSTFKMSSDSKDLRQAQARDQQEGKKFSQHAGWTTYNGKIYLPEEIRTQIVKEIHETPTGGHQGVFKTHARLTRYYDFPDSRRRTQEIIRQCETCAKAKSSRHKPYGELQPLPVPEKPWDSVSMDFITKLPVSKEPGTGTKYDSIIVIVDRLSKYAYFIPFQETHTASDTAHVFLKNVVSNHGLPKEIISDRDKLFTSKFWKALIEQLGIRHKLSTAYHPQTDGQTERTNQTLEQYLRCYINYQQDDWVRLLPTAQLAYNSATTETTKTTPFFANYGFEPEVTHMPGTDQEATVPQAKIEVTKMATVWQQLRQELEFIQERMKRYANIKRIEGPTFKRGDMVYLTRRNIKTKRPSNKLDFKKLGPFRVQERVSNVNYRLELPQAMRIHPVFHVSLLEPAPRNATPDTTTEIEDEEPEYEVESVLDARSANDTVEYLVKWKDYPHEENTWEPREHLTGCPETVRQYHQQHPDRPEGTDPETRSRSTTNQRKSDQTRQQKRRTPQ